MLPDGRKQCPFCHSIFDKEGVGNKITEQGVISNITRFHQGTAVLTNDETSTQNSLLHYKPIQKQVQNQMFGIDQEEMKTKKDLSETEQGIHDIKKGKGSFLSKLLFGAWKMAFIVAGGILLITLARMAFRAWSKNFMPKSDGSKFKIFGLEIPGLGEIKAFGLGIWNTITVGLPNLWNRVKNFFGKIHKQLFGKKGMFRDAIETRNTLRKIGAAFIIGLSTKATGPIFKILGFLLGLIPGAGPFLQFICKLMPAIIKFVSMQIMLHWSNAKADSERELKDLTKKFSSSNLLSNFMSMSSKVKPFVPPRAIPGLEIPKRGRGPAVHGAIMRKTSIGVVGHSKTAKKLQNKLLDKELDEGAKEDKKRYVYDEKNPNSKWTLLSQAALTRGEYEGMSEEEAGQNRLRIYNKVIAPQVSKLDAYILYLSKSKRFQNVKGPLYDINTGWNPGYRVFQSDLMSPIPLTPFEDIHTKYDVSIGQPGGRSEDWLGVMPFTWTQHGATVSAHPIKYELERAKRIRGLWIDMWHDIEDYGEGSGGLFSDDMESPEEAANQVLKKIVPSYSKKWRETAYVA